MTTTLEDLQVTGAQRTPHQGDAAGSNMGLLERVAIVDNQATGFVRGTRRSATP
jgi:hypothetical protein